jgi:hypothetical protein
MLSDYLSKFSDTTILLFSYFTSIFICILAIHILLLLHGDRKRDGHFFTREALLSRDKNIAGLAIDLYIKKRSIQQKEHWMLLDNQMLQEESEEAGAIPQLGY